MMRVCLAFALATAASAKPWESGSCVKNWDCKWGERCVLIDQPSTPCDGSRIGAWHKCNGREGCCRDGYTCQGSASWSACKPALGRCEAKQKNRCKRADGSKVDNGWTGKGLYNDWCNDCSCTLGVLTCTDETCPTKCRHHWDCSWGEHCVTEDTSVEACDTERIMPWMRCNSDPTCCTAGHECVGNSWWSSCRPKEGVCKPKPPTTCKLSDDTVVKNGWRGMDKGENHCNTCICNHGTLACTTHTCPPVTTPCCHDGDCESDELCKIVIPVLEPCEGRTLHPFWRCNGRENCCPEGRSCQGSKWWATCKPIQGMCQPKPIPCEWKDGTVVADGWAGHFDDVCQQCTCTRGVVTCVREECEVPQCEEDEVVYRPADTCCSVCRPIATRTCTADGVEIADGQPVPSGNPCHTCTCLKGITRCELTTPCPPLPCGEGQQTYYAPGACCPTCRVPNSPPGACTLKDGTSIPTGTMVPSSDPCIQGCVCIDGGLRCAPVQWCHPLVCPEGHELFTPEGVCCPTCRPVAGRSCRLADGSFAPHGTSARGSGADYCHDCACEDGKYSCPEEVCPQKQCCSGSPQAGEKCCGVSGEWVAAEGGVYTCGGVTSAAPHGGPFGKPCPM